MSTDPRAQLPLQSVALLTARDFLGVQEVSENEGPEIDLFQEAAQIADNAPWCAAFVNYCAEFAAELKGVESPLETVPLQGYVQSYVEWARDRGRIVQDEDGELVGVGDLFCLYYPWLNDGQGRYGHVGFVDDPNVDGGRRVFSTVEGNTSPAVAEGSAAEREGEGVYAKERGYNGRVIFIRWAREPYRG